ncbi:MAG: hypothetical protein ACWGSD_06240 [Thermodesulfobacteriota bacterium]
MASAFESIDRTRIEPTASDTLEVQVCEVSNEPDMTFLRALKAANRVEEPEKVVRYYRAALAVREDAAASAFLYRLCRLLDENPDVLVREFGGAYLLEAWVEEERYLVQMIKERICCKNPDAHWNGQTRRGAWTDVAHGKGGKKISLDEVIDILEDLALRYAEKADSESTLGNPRGMRQDLWKSKGIVEAADLLRKMFRS